MLKEKKYYIHKVNHSYLFMFQ